MNNPSALTALVTGASTGLGEQLARQLASYGVHLLLVALEEDRLEALANELRTTQGIQVWTLALDLTDPGATAVLESEVHRHNLTVDFLINNAGIGDFGAFATLDRQKQLRMVALNVAALTDLTHRFLPGMLERGRGRILNVASIAGFMPGPLMTVYYATKAYVLSFSEGLQGEVCGTGVYVTALCPGPMRTDFVCRAHMQNSAILHGGLNELLVCLPHKVAQRGIEAMWRGDSVCVVGLTNKLATLVPRLLPRPLLPKIVYQLQRPQGKKR